jgi:hypothetical protein
MVDNRYDYDSVDKARMDIAGERKDIYVVVNTPLNGYRTHVP